MRKRRFIVGMAEAVRMVLGSSTLLSFLLFSKTKCLLLLLLGMRMSGKSREDTSIGLLDMDTKWDRLGEEYVRVQSPARKVSQTDKVLGRVIRCSPGTYPPS